VAEKRFFPLYRERETGRALLEMGFGAAPSQSGLVYAVKSEGVTVRAEMDSETYRFYQRLVLTVHLIPDPGLHIYGRPIPDGFMPATVAIEPVEGIEVGAQTWPEPHPMRIEGLDEQFLVYDGQVTVAVPVTFLMREGDQVLQVSISYQACSDTDCMMPQTVSLTIPVKALAHAEAP